MKFCKFHSILLFKGILLGDNVIMCYFLPIMILHITQNLGKKKHEASSTFEAKKISKFLYISRLVQEDREEKGE